MPKETGRASDKKRIEKFVGELKEHLSAAGFKRSASEIKYEVSGSKPEDQWIGWYTKAASWGDERNIEVLLDNSFRDGRLRFWYGFTCNTKRPYVATLAKRLIKSWEIVPYIEGKDDDNDEWDVGTPAYRLLERGGLAREKYKDRWKDDYLGQYQLKDMTDEEALKNAASFFVSVARDLKVKKKKKKKNASFEDALFDEIEKDPKLSITEKEQLIKARIGQGKFRRLVAKEHVQRLGGQLAPCAVTGCTADQALRASHIVSWKDDRKNRLNPSNGLLLTAHIDALFDRHLITFAQNGEMLTSDTISSYNRKRLQISKRLRLRKKLLTEKRIPFLAIHRANFRKREKQP